MIRFLLGLLVLVSIFLFPWWTVFAVLLVLLFRFTPYYEVFVFTLLMDAVYSTGDFGWWFLLGGTVCFFLSLFVHERIRTV